MDVLVSSGGFGGGELGAFPLRLPHGFDISPEAGKRGGDFLVTGGEVFVQQFFAGCETLVEMQGLDLQRETALDILEAEISRGGMSRFDNVKQVGVGVGGKEGERRRLTPVVDPFGVEVERGVAFDRQ